MDISTTAPIRSVLDSIRHHSHAAAGFSTGLVGAASASLGQAVLGISGGSRSRLAEIVVALEDMADEDVGALDRLVALRDQGREGEGWESLMASPAAMADLACEAAEILEGFRPQVIDKVRDDMEFAIVMLTAAARSALLILESNLRQWRDPVLAAKFGPVSDRLAGRVAALKPMDRIAWR